MNNLINNALFTNSYFNHFKKIKNNNFKKTKLNSLSVNAEKMMGHQVLPNCMQISYSELNKDHKTLMNIQLPFENAPVNILKELHQRYYTCLRLVSSDINQFHIHICESYRIEYQALTYQNDNVFTLLEKQYYKKLGVPSTNIFYQLETMYEYSRSIKIKIDLLMRAYDPEDSGSDGHILRNIKSRTFVIYAIKYLKEAIPQLSKYLMEPLARTNEDLSFNYVDNDDYTYYPMPCLDSSSGEDI